MHSMWLTTVHDSSFANVIKDLDLVNYKACNGHWMYMTHEEMALVFPPRNLLISIYEVRDTVRPIRKRSSR